MVLSGEGEFSQGDEIMSSSNAKAIVDSYDSETNKLTYYQTAQTGFNLSQLVKSLLAERLKCLSQ